MIQIKNISGLGFTLALAFVMAGTLGYIMNLVKLFGMSFDAAHAGEIIVRIAGLIPFIGAFAGYF